MKWTVPSLRRRPLTKAAARRQPVRNRFRPQVEGLEQRLAPANVDWLTWHGDNFLSGWNNQETILTPQNVNPASFGRLFNYAVDGYVYAQPLYKANLAINNQTFNVVFAATEGDSVYAFNADAPTGGPANNGVLWQTSFLLPRAGFTVTTVPSGDTGSGDIVPQVGITGTPVIDAATNTMYVVAKTKEVETATNIPHYVHRLYAVNITNGSILRTVVIGDTTNTGDTVIADNATDIRITGANTGRLGDTTPPSGPGVQGGEFRFNSRRALHRGAVVLAPPDANHPNGVVYVDFASHGDNGNYRGWVVGYDPTNFQLQQYFLTALDVRAAGIWQSGSPVAIDAQNNLYFATGNAFGATPATVGPRNLTESVVRIGTDSATGQLVYRDSFIPFNWQALDQADADLGSGGTMLLPDAVGDLLPNGTRRRLIVETGKEGKIYLLDRDDLGGLSPTAAAEAGRIRDVLVQGVGGVWASPAFIQTGPNEGLVFYHGSGTDLRAFLIRDGRFVRGTSAGASVTQSGVGWPFPGSQPTISSDGTNNVIVWELQTNNYNQQGPETLYAWRLDLPAPGGPGTGYQLTQLYNSNQIGLRDVMGPSVKFVVPVIANGKVFAGTNNRLEIFGLFPPATEVPAAPANLAAAPASASQITLTWENGPIQQNLVRIERSTAGPDGPFTQVQIVGGSATSFTDTGLQPATQYFYRIRGENNVGLSAYSNVADARTRIPNPVLTIDSICSTQVDLSWNGNPSFNDHFTLERSTDGGQTWVVIAPSLPPTQLTYSDTALMRDTYQYRVRAFNTSGETSLSNVVTATVGPVTIDYSDGFPLSGQGLMLQGTPTPPLIVAPGFLNLTNGGDFGQAASAFATTRVGITNFSTEFTFRLHDGTDPRADGFAFVIQAISPAALGPAGGGLGYGPDQPNVAGDPRGIRNSIAIKFDLFQNVSEGTNSTGIFSDGRSPSVRRGDLPATPTPTLPDRTVNLNAAPYLRPDGTPIIQLNNQELKRAIITYDGTTLTERIEGDDPDEFVEINYQVDLRAILGSDTAFVGFTGGTGGLTVVQDIRTWRFESRATTPGAPSNLRITNSTDTEVSLAWRCNSYNEDGFKIERSTDGVNFTQVGTTGPNTTSFTDTPPAEGLYFYRVRAFNDQGDSTPSNIVVVAVGPIDLNYCDGFGTGSGLTANGAASFTRNVAQLTPALNGLAGSVFTNQRVGIESFYTTFNFRFHDGTTPPADGMAFVLQALSPSALGGGGGSLGYEGISRSAAVKFDFFQNGADPSANTTGLFTNGQAPFGGTNLNGTGINFGTDHNFRADVAYNGTTLFLTITDRDTNASFSTTFTVDLFSVLGADSAYVGFTAGTGGLNAVQDIQTWCFTSFVTRPLAPTNLFADPYTDPSHISLYWLDNSDNEDGFVIERSADGVNYEVLATTGPDVTSFNDFTASWGTYNYRVKAFNAQGESRPSNTVVVAYRVPEAPSDLAATRTTSTQVDLQWFNNAFSQDGFRVERSVGDASNFAAIATTGRSTTRFTDTDVTAPNVYFYRVVAFNEFGDSRPSNTLRVELRLTIAPVAYWNFEEAPTAPTVVDVSGNGNNGTIQGNVTRVAGAPGPFGTFGRGLMFPGGQGDQVIVPNSASLNPRNAISISAWFNAIDWNGNRRLVQKGDNDNQYRLLAEGGLFKFDLSGVGSLTTALPSTGAWHQVVATYDGATMKIFLDGTLRASQAATGLINITSDPFNIGTKVANATAGDHFNGVLDEVKVFERALTDDEIRALQIATDQDIGNVASRGSSQITGIIGTAGAAFSIQGSGDDIWNNADAFHFTYTPVTGNFRITARVQDVTPTDYWAKAALMARESLAANSRHVSLVETPNRAPQIHGEISLQWRDDTGGSSASSDQGVGSGPVPYWIRLTRNGNNFTAEKSVDGVTWVLLNNPTHTLALPETLYVGLAVTAHNNDGRLNTSIFTNVSIEPMPAAAGFADQGPAIDDAFFADEGNLDDALPPAFGGDNGALLVEALTPAEPPAAVETPATPGADDNVPVPPAPGLGQGLPKDVLRDLARNLLAQVKPYLDAYGLTAEQVLGKELFHLL